MLSRKDLSKRICRRIKNSQLEHLNQHLARSAIRTNIRFPYRNGKCYFTPKRLVQNEKVTTSITDEIILDSLQSDPAYIDSVLQSHNLHRPQEVAEKKRRNWLAKKYKPLLSRYCGVHMDFIVTEESEEEIARVVVIDGLFRVIMDEYILPRSPVLDLNVKNTGMTIETLLEHGRPYEEVREMFIESVGEKTICGYLLSSMFCGLEYTPARYANNDLIDLAHHNTTNFHVMVRNNFRHTLYLDFAAMSRTLLETVYTDPNAKNGAITCVKILHYILEDYLKRSEQIADLNLNRHKKKHFVSNLVEAISDVKVTEYEGLEEVQNIPLATRRIKEKEPERRIEEKSKPSFSKAELLEMQLRATSFELAEE
ncbi:Oidioi.mRNA.OKI2018_I69.chr1.g267.t1.cds [Oikopleura dioica]|uniref:Oidioi.mRNA.OKI2018_I69.chr1.g267.t1.cds n=1 Tax=Oikopleura dioica TaxID=34765 RepID=A0ABN7SN19_OIKDI|nr:Oidioi.mRNA.OKI2018_I69.chr1.g267.t1.cds [Oikopleura dioica]